MTGLPLENTSVSAELIMWKRFECLLTLHFRKFHSEVVHKIRLYSSGLSAYAPCGTKFSPEFDIITKGMQTNWVDDKNNLRRGRPCKNCFKE